nr:hypothetical protein [Leptolyngbya sp. FACHB-17]
MVIGYGLNAATTVQYEPPKVILQKLRSLEAEIKNDLDELERLL